MMENSELIFELNKLVSEEQNPDTLDIDLLNTLDVVKKLNHQDDLVAKAVSQILPEIAEAVDLIVNCFKQDGRLIYLGAGTSGRLGVLDAVECVPTFGVTPDQVIGLIAGGESAMFKAIEGSEDDESSAVDALKAINFCEKDVLVGIAASGRTPYVIGGLDYARSVGAASISLSCNPKSEISRYVDISLIVLVGPEALTGSTRMKSGTAQKMVLNILSTAAMIRSGKSYKNLMVDVKATNQKLYARATRMVMQITGVNQTLAEKTLELADRQVKLAVLMLLAQVDCATAKDLLKRTDGFLRKALQLSNLYSG
jgi:N-acetylmuramic acid 6-phosphate etherase